MIPPGARGELIFAEHCHIALRVDVVVRDMADGAVFRSYPIPALNTSMLLLGDGTSIGSDAAYALARAGVSFFYTGSGGTPLWAGVTADLLPISGVSEYGPTEYMQAWVRRFFEESQRLEAAKELLRTRARLTQEFWGRALDFGAPDLAGLYKGTEFLREIESASNTQELLAAAGRQTKRVYTTLTAVMGAAGFSRKPHGNDLINRRIDHFDHLLNGCTLLVLHGLGLSVSFPALQDKTRRGGLVFDIAGLLNEGLALPLAFQHGMGGTAETDARGHFIDTIHQEQVIPLLFRETRRILCGK